MSIGDDGMTLDEEIERGYITIEPPEDEEDEDENDEDDDEEEA
jgi:hypothetical protein